MVETTSHAPTPIIRNETARLSVSVRGSGRSVWDSDGVAPIVDQLEVLERRAPEAIVALFQDSAVWRRSRRYLVGGAPAMLAVSYIPVDLAAGTPMTQRDSGPGGVFARLAEAGFAPTRFSEDVWADAPSDDERDQLGLDHYVPVLRARRVAFHGDRAVEVSDMTMVSSAFRLRFEFPA